MVQAPVLEGSVLADKYRVERVLGAGAMGVVVAATHVQLGQRVALKFLLPQSCSQPGAVERFLREARAVVRIQSEHVARVSDVGTLQDGAPYMVMEYLEGMDLGQWLESRGALPIADAVDHVLQAGEAIAEAHAARIVHRDLKPANLFLCRRADGSSLIKVLDFGISKLALSDGDEPALASMTSTTAVMGSPMYMSPEQIRSSKNVDARTDIWSLGVILHQLMTGRTVFESDSLSGLLARVVADPPARLREHLPHAPAELERVILGCLEKDPARRFQNMAELAQALAPFAPPQSRLSIERIAGILRVPAAGNAPTPVGLGGTAIATSPGDAFSSSASTPPVAVSSAPSVQATSGGAWGSTHQSASGRSSLKLPALIASAVLLAMSAAATLLFRSLSARQAAPDVAVHSAAVVVPSAAGPGAPSAAGVPPPLVSAPPEAPQPSAIAAVTPVPSAATSGSARSSAVHAGVSRPPAAARSAAQQAPAAAAEHPAPVASPAPSARAAAPFDDRK